MPIAPIVMKPFVVTLLLQSGQEVDVIIQAASVEAAERELRLTFQQGSQLRFPQPETGEMVVIYNQADLAGVRIRPAAADAPARAALPPA